jgi:hypothetical protein
MVKSAVDKAWVIQIICVADLMQHNAITWLNRILILSKESNGIFPCRTFQFIVRFRRDLITLVHHVTRPES